MADKGFGKGGTIYWSVGMMWLCLVLNPIDLLDLIPAMLHLQIPAPRPLIVVADLAFGLICVEAIEQAELCAI